MIQRILNNRLTQYVLIASISLGALLCIFTPDYYFFKSFSKYAVQIMFGYLILGLFFLIQKQPRLVFTSFIACGVMALYLKNITNSVLRNPEITEDSAVIKIAHIKTSNINEEPEGAIQAMLESGACLLSVPNIDPFLYDVLRQELGVKYPYCTSRFGFDPGLAIFSKYPILNLDTIMTDGLPNIIGSIQAGGTGEKLFFVSSCTLPPFYTRDYKRLQTQLNLIAEKAKVLNGPIITMGDYNLVQWSDEIQEFRTTAKLKDSRRGIVPGDTPDLLTALFTYPHDHIFFSEHFKCIAFENLSSLKETHIGIQGSFQFIPEEEINDKGATQ